MKHLPGILLSFFLLSFCSCSTGPSQTGGSGVQQAPKDALQLVFTYGSEKEKWIKDVTAQFNAEQHKTSKGKIIFVDAIPMGSGECIDELLSGRRQAHLTSPASAAF